VLDNTLEDTCALQGERGAQKGGLWHTIIPFDNGRLSIFTNCREGISSGQPGVEVALLGNMRTRQTEMLGHASIYHHALHFLPRAAEYAKQRGCGYGVGILLERVGVRIGVEGSGSGTGSFLLSCVLQRFFRVEPRGIEPLTSALPGRYDRFQECSQPCEMTIDMGIFAETLFPVFQVLHSGCCTVAAHLPSL
jgi:hypothetical protein